MDEFDAYDVCQMIREEIERERDEWRQELQEQWGGYQRGDEQVERL